MGEFETGRRFTRGVGLLGLVLWLGGAAVHAENAAFVLAFGGEPGAPLPHAYDYGQPPVTEGTYTMRIPVIDPAVAGVLHDTELHVDAKQKQVLAVRATRAFRSVADCEAARALLNGKLAKALTAPWTGSGPWEFSSADGAVVGGAWCRTERHLPFTTLELELKLAPKG